VIEGKPIPAKAERNEEDEVVELLGRLLARAWLRERRMSLTKVLPDSTAPEDVGRHTRNDGDNMA
jgi:hypothetical protein